MRPIVRRLAVAVAISVLAVTPVAADDPSHDRTGDLLRHGQEAAAERGSPSPLVADNFEVLGHANLGGGAPNGDVYLYDHGGTVGKYAYVGTWSAQCTGQGAKIIDVNDPTHPKWVGFVGARKGSSNEDVVVARIGDRDVLGIGVQFCGKRGSDGLALFDVTDPRHPFELSFLPTPSGVHELDIVVRENEMALALLATPFTEFSNTYFGTDSGGEFRLVNISDPENPVALADWGIIADSDLLIQGGNDEVTSSFQGLPGFFAAHYAHSVRAADGGMTAYVSYWDGGILKFDISDPGAPDYLGRTVYPAGASGDGHSMTTYEVGGTRYILQNDEDFDTIPSILATSSVTGALQADGLQMPWVPVQLTDGGQTVSGVVHDAGVGCNEADYAGALGKVALADAIDGFYVGIIPDWPEPPCTLGEQAVLAKAAGATALVLNLISPDDAYYIGPGTDPSAAAGLSVFMIADIDDLAAGIRTAGGTSTVTVTAQEPSWGYIRVFEETVGDEWPQVGSFTGAPHAFGEFVTPPGSWSVHNTEVLGDRAYSSWYSNGIVALDLSVPTIPQVVGQFVPNTSNRHANSLGVGPAEVWGVAIDPETGVVYASDMRTGLWIIQPVGVAAPSE